MKFIKKQIVIEAMLFTDRSKQDVYNWVRDQQMNIVPSFENGEPILIIPTLEGDMICSIGDYLIKEPFPTDWRKFYPCKPSIFEQTYEPFEPFRLKEDKKTGVELITAERREQIDRFGFTGEHHTNHPEWYDDGQLINAANMLSSYDEQEELTYLYRDVVPVNWNKEWWERLCDKPLIERLAIAASFYAAEIDRLNSITESERSVATEDAQ